MKFILLVLAAISFQMATAQLPNNFTIEEDVMSIGTDFELSGCEGYIDQKLLSLSSSFTLRLDKGVCAISKQRIFSIGSKIDIFDGQGRKLGMIEEQIFSNWGVYSRYVIYDKYGKKIAESRKHQLMATEFVITDMNGKTICVITRPAINFFSDTWRVSFKDSSYDKRLFIFIPCYKTYRDNCDD